RGAPAGIGLMALDEFLEKQLRQLWINGMRHGYAGFAIDADEMDRRVRSLLERYPPIKTETGWDVAPVVYGLAIEIGRDPIEFADWIRAGQQEVQAERAAAVEAAQDIMKGGHC
ncbi:MAG TPA: hypothetical protein VMS54_09270, partial [Vicinamibacterales bacterium]|nr:hypothetical protein [Vicinamibacterales bacterium]